MQRLFYIIKNVMAKQKKAKTISRGAVHRAAALFAALCFVLVFLSPGTHLCALSFGVLYTLGLVGYWVILPLAFCFSLYILFRKKGFHLPIRIYVGSILILLGAIALVADLGGQGNEKLSTFASYHESLVALYGAKGFSSVLNLNVGGGALGYVIAGPLCEYVGRFLPILVGALVVAVGLFICFFPLIKRFFLFLRSRAAVRKAKRIQEEEDRRNGIASYELGEKGEPDLPSIAPESEQEEPIPFVPEPTPAPDPTSAPEPEPLPEAPAPLFSNTANEPEEEQKPFIPRPKFVPAGDIPLPSRKTLRPEPEPEPEPEPAPAPAPMPANVYVERPLTHVGLQEAFFIPSGFAAAPASTSTPMQADALPSATEPIAPIPAQQAEEEDDEEDDSFLRQITPDLPAHGVPKNTDSLYPEEPTFVPPMMEPEENNPEPELEPEVVSIEPEPEPEPAPQQSAPFVAPPVAPQQPVQSVVPPAPAPEPEPEPQPAGDGVNQPLAKPRPAYTFPSFDLLATYPDDGNQAAMEQECLERTEIINRALANYGIGARVVNHIIGPSVTRYDIETDPNVSASAIGHRITDIQRLLGGVAGRFSEMIVGSTASGLEIANTSTRIVSFKETIMAMPTGPKYNLQIPFGMSIEGKVVSADLSAFPHMLVAGTTGSGKSIFMHGIIMSLIMRNRPEDLKLVMVDPKRVEMGKYKDLPHLLCPIVKEPSHAKVCMDKLCTEMDRRYGLFEAAGVSGIREFNEDYCASSGKEKLPFIVVFIDEYADLVDQAKDIQGLVLRIAQKARAAGIHLVIATQRPDVKVITGTIKANLPVRVALSVANSTDSTTILGQGGAEDLAGHGDMLIDCTLVQKKSFVRAQGCFVKNSEIKDVCDFIRGQQKVVYNPDFLDLEDHSSEDGAAEFAMGEMPDVQLMPQQQVDMRKAAGEEKYQLIKAAVMAREFTSISQIQRDYGVGFPRAGKIFSRLQQEGIVASNTDAPTSSRGCRVLIHEMPSDDEGNPGSLSQSDVTPGGDPNL